MAQHVLPYHEHDPQHDLVMHAEVFAAGGDRIFPAALNPELIATDILFGEGPVWDKRAKALYFTDIIGDAIWKFTPGAGLATVLFPSEHANGMTLDREGRLVVCGWGGRTLFRFEKDGSRRTLATQYAGKKLNSPNDVVVKSDGYIYFTDPPGGLFNVGHVGSDLQRYLEVQPVFRLSPDGRELTIVTTDFVYPNGLCFSPDEKILYVNCSRERVIRAYDVLADGAVANMRLFYKYTDAEHGNPDGIKCDVDGNVWCTGPAGIQVHKPSGERIARLRMKGHATNFCFGGDDWKDLYITCVGSVVKTRVNIAGVASW